MASAAYGGSNGGAGGKFRKRPFRKAHTTPYDRPPSSLRPTQIINNNNNGWLSKIVDPASKLITAGANKFFSSVFRKRLLLPPQSSLDEAKEMEYMQPKTATNVVTSETKVPVDCGVNDGSMPSDSNGVTDLEDILKQKTFTRSQIDHLTALLHSRNIENSDGAEKGRSEPKLAYLQAVHAGHDKLSNLPAHENQMEHAQSAAFLTPEVRSKVLSDDVASPAEIAKAYMGSRSTKGSPSVLRLQNQLPKGDLSTPFNPLSKSLSPVTSLTQKPVSDIGTSSKGFMTPRFRGRSAIYSMARTPYSRVHSVSPFKAAETSVNTGGGSSYLDESENNPSNKPVLKRRSSVLENDIGSVGPIRRIRQKPNLLHPKILSLPPPFGRQGTHVSRVLSDVAEMPSSMEQSSQNRSFSKVFEKNSLPVTSGGYVPSQSIEMAQKIFEQLDKFSPKGSLGKNVDLSVGISPTKTPVMESLDSLKPLQNSEDIKKLIGSLDSVDALNQTQTSSMAEEVSAKVYVTASASLGPQDGAVGKKAGSYLSNKRAAEYLMPVSVVDRPQKQAFQMSAHEDFLELDDDDLPSNEVALSAPLTGGRQHAESPTKSNAIRDILPRDQAITVEKPPAQLRKNELKFVANGSSASEATSSFSSSVVLSSPPASNVTIVDAMSAPKSILKSDKVAPQNETCDIFIASSTKSDKVVCTSPPAAKDTKLETSIRVVAEVNGPDKVDNKSTPVFGNTVIKSKDSSSVEAFSNVSQTNNATPANGVFSTVPAKADASFPFLFTSCSNNQSSVPVTPSSPSPSATSKFSDFGAQPTFTPSASTPAISSTSNPSASVYTFVSGFSSPSTTSSTSASDATDKSGAKLDAIGLGNAASSLLDAKPSAFTAPALISTGGDVLSAGSTTSNKITFSFQTGSTPVLAFAPSFSGQSAPSFSGQPASSVSASASTSALSFPGQSASSVSVPVSTSAPSFLAQSAPSPSAFVFGSSGSAGSSSGSVFGSFSANPFGSGSSTSSSALGSSFTSSSLSTTSSTTSSIFGFTSQSPKPTPTIAAASPPSSVFSFGLGSFGTTTSSSAFGATVSSSASNSSPFVFGGNSGLAASTPATTNSPFQTQPTFGNASSQPFAFGSTPSTNSDQMTMEDTMAEDSLQPSTPAQPAFGVAPISAPGGFAFNATPAAVSPFQFNTQPSQIPPQNPFQASGSLEFNGGTNSSFSLGTNDKSQRRIVRVKKGARRR